MWAPLACLPSKAVIGHRQADGRGPSLKALEEWSQLEEICRHKEQIPAKVLKPLEVCLHTEVVNHVSNTVFKASTWECQNVEASPLGKGLGAVLHCQSIPKTFNASIAGCTSEKGCRPEMELAWVWDDGCVG